MIYRFYLLFHSYSEIIFLLLKALPYPIHFLITNPPQPIAKVNRKNFLSSCLYMLYI